MHRALGFAALVFLLFRALPCWGQIRFYNLPQIANGSFGDVTFRSSFILLNNSDTNVLATLSLTDDAGKPLSVGIGGLGTGSRTCDFIVPVLPAQVSISGRVTDTSGNGVANIYVSVRSSALTGAADTSFYGGARTDSGGNYTVPVLSGTGYENRLCCADSDSPDQTLRATRPVHSAFYQLFENHFDSSIRSYDECFGSRSGSSRPVTARSVRSRSSAYSWRSRASPEKLRSFRTDRIQPCNSLQLGWLGIPISPDAATTHTARAAPTVVVA